MKKKRKFKSPILKAHLIKGLTILLYVVSILIVANTTYLISPLPFDDFQAWRAGQMDYVFAAFTVLLLATILLPGWVIHKGMLKTAAVLSFLSCTLPLMWLVSIFSLAVD